MKIFRPESFSFFIGAFPRKAALLLFFLALLLGGGVAAVRGQSALDGFDPNANGTIRAVAVQPDGKILIGGDFTTLAPNGGAVVTCNHLARLNPDGTLDPAFSPNPSQGVNAIAVQADGRILVTGPFSGENSIGGQTRNYIARLDPGTGLADSFDPNANGLISSIVVQADGMILAGGSFSFIGGQTRHNIARLDPTNGVADSFNPNANGPVFSLAVQTDGKILAGGNFFGTNSIGGQLRNHLARLDPVTGLADSFDPNANGHIFCLALQADGKILAGGQFAGTNSIGGRARNHIARLDAVTGLADSFNPNATNVVMSIVVQQDGKVLAGGDFGGANSIGGQARNYLARLDPVTGLADSFDPGANNYVNAIALLADGSILAGGLFSAIGGQPRSFFARLINDTTAGQNLAVTQTNAVWTCAGASPQFTRVTFEVSTDQASYAFLGQGVASGNNWTLAGLNLPPGQNLYLRARGYYSSGEFNGSGSILESMGNVFISSSPVLNIQRSENANVVLSWATNFPGFTLESRPNISTNDWSVVFPSSSVSGTNNVVTNTVSGPPRFYRLRK